MNCEDYKEAIAADPSQSFDDAGHAAQCASCREFREQMLALDERISGALKIPVPDLQMPELPPVGEDDANVVNLPVRDRGRFKTPVWLGLAASVIVAAFLGVRFVTDDTVYPSLEAEIMAHLDHEPRALRVTTERVSERRLEKVVRDDVSNLRSDIGLITYARSCVINGHSIPHLVIQGERGPITLLLLPDEAVESARPLVGKGVNGVILPVGNGSVAIIGERDEPLNKVEQRVLDSVEWRT